MRTEFAEKEAALRAEFETKLQEIKRKSADELNTCKTEMITKLKREYGESLQMWTKQFEIFHFTLLFRNKTESRYEKFKADKEEEQLDMQRNYKRKLSDADVKTR